MAMTTNLASWLAGRVGGSKAANRTRNFMNKTLVGNLLGIAGDSFITGQAFKGAGALKDLVTGGGKAAQAYDPAVALAKAREESDGLIGKIPLGDAQSAHSVMESRFAPGTKPLDMSGMAQQARAGVTQMPSLTPNPPAGGLGIGSIKSVPTSAFAPLPTNIAQRTLSAAPKASSLQQLFDLAKANPEITSGIIQGGFGAYSAAADRELARQELERQRQQRESLAALLMPMYAQYYGIGG